VPKTSWQHFLRGRKFSKVLETFVWRSQSKTSESTWMTRNKTVFKVSTVEKLRRRQFWNTFLTGMKVSLSRQQLFLETWNWENVPVATYIVILYSQTSTIATNFTDMLCRAKHELMTMFPKFLSLFRANSKTSKIVCRKES